MKWGTCIVEEGCNGGQDWFNTMGLGPKEQKQALNTCIMGPVQGFCLELGFKVIAIDKGEELSLTSPFGRTSLHALAGFSSSQLYRLLRKQARCLPKCIKYNRLLIFIRNKSVD